MLESTHNTGDALMVIAVVVGALCALCIVGAVLAWVSDHIVMPWLVRRRAPIIQPQNRAARRRQKKVKQYWGV